MTEQSYGDWIRSNPPRPTKEYKTKHMAQQTAVEYLMNHFRMLHIWHDGEPDEMLEAFEQAERMNEQQTIDAYKHGQNNGYNYRSNGRGYITGEEYFEQTFTTQAQ